MALQSLLPMDHEPTERRLAGGDAAPEYRPALHPGESWTPEAAASFVAQHDHDVSESLARLQTHLEAAYPHGSVFVHRYTAETLCRYCSTRRGSGGQAMGYVETRLPVGESYSGTVSVRWEDGAVVATENPAVPS